MTSSILVTKLFIPPTRSDLVPRPRLIEQLNDGLHRKLTLISAPAGFGKTTLVSEWVDNVRLDAKNETQVENRISWLSLDEGDNDLVRFLTYFIAALNQIEGQETPFGTGALAMLQSPQPPPAEAVLTPLINEIATIPDRIILVLDDYHLIDTQQIHDALSFLLEKIPPQMHLVIATREDPPLPLPRLRAREQLTELRAVDLRFTSSEAAKFLNQVMGLNLTHEDIVALETRTEGWIAGLQLAAISLQGREDTSGLIKSFTGSHRLVLDYLIEEVLDQQPASMQSFLLQTSILDRMNGPLCDALTGQVDGQQTLEYLDHANLFIVPLDDDRQWYRYHNLFADLLNQHLEQTEIEQLPLLYTRASKWFQAHGYPNEAIMNALRAGDYERAADLIEAHLGGNYEQVDQTTLARWLAEFPAELVDSNPYLCILNAWYLFNNGQLDAAGRSLQVAEKLLDTNTDEVIGSTPDQNELSATYKLRLSGRIAAIRSFLASYSGDIPGTIQHAQQAIDVLPEQELEWRSTAYIALGDAYAIQGQMVAAHQARSHAMVAGKASGDTHLLMIVNLSLAETLRQQGKLQQVLTILERQEIRATKSGISESAVVGWLYGIWGDVLAELNDLDRALVKVNKGVELAARGRDVTYIVLSNLYKIRVLYSNGDMIGAEEVIQTIENNSREYDISHGALLQLSAWQVRIWLAQEKLEIVSQWVREHEMDADRELTYLHETENIGFARVLIAQGRLDESIRLLHRLFETAEVSGRILKVIEILILQALAFHSKGDKDGALASLEMALTLAEPEGFIRIFVDEGQGMASLLGEALSRDIAPIYVAHILKVFSQEDQHQPGVQFSKEKNDALIEPLSEREIEVLQLIAEGLTNPEIASRLFLSLNTVKVHTRNLYGKLGVNNRTQAAAKAAALGVVPPDPG